MDPGAKIMIFGPGDTRGQRVPFATLSLPFVSGNAFEFTAAVLCNVRGGIRPERGALCL